MSSALTYNQHGAILTDAQRKESADRLHRIENEVATAFLAAFRVAAGPLAGVLPVLMQVSAENWSLLLQGLQAECGKLPPMLDEAGGAKANAVTIEVSGGRRVMVVPPWSNQAPVPRLGQGVPLLSEEEWSDDE